MKPSRGAVLLGFGVTAAVVVIVALVWSRSRVLCVFPGTLEARAQVDEAQVRIALSMMQSELQRDMIARDALQATWPEYFTEGYAESMHMRFAWDDVGRPLLCWAGVDGIPGNDDDRIAHFDDAGEAVVEPLRAY